MTSRERVLRCLEFGSPDRAPRDLWPLPWVGMYAADDLAAVKARFPMDIERIPLLPRSNYFRGQFARKGVYVDDFNCPFEAGEDGVTGEVRNPPLADWSALAAYKLPYDMHANFSLDWANRAVAQARGPAERFVIGDANLRVFERMQFLRGSENLFYDLGYLPSEFFRLRDMLHEFYMEELELLCRTDADAFRVLDDWGSQTSLLISPAQWRELFKPLYAQYARRIHQAGKKMMFHSDGFIFEIYPDLIEIGVDAINSQLFCMDIEEIGRRFGGKITFWGEISRQDTLPFGRPADVYRSVARVRRALDSGRGGLIAQCEWGVANPPANIAALYEAWELPLEDLLGRVDQP